MCDFSGSAKFEEATAYIEKHRLYKESLEIWHAHNDERNSILNLYGDYLFDRREFRQAALGAQAFPTMPTVDVLTLGDSIHPR